MCQNQEVRVVLISTYELGRQPFGVASPAAWLRRAGADVRCLDLSREPLDESAVREADAVAFYLPMHTATRLALPVLDRVRALNPAARVAAFGLYAPTNHDLLRARGVTAVMGAEFEQGLTAWAVGSTAAPAPAGVPRLTLTPPDRSGLPPLSRYVTLQVDGERRTAAYTEASRGCRHRCRHCPVVPVYDGQFRIVPVDVVIADIRQQVEEGALHVTFGDPDFLNGPAHALRVVEAVRTTWPGLTYDVTIKVEHLLRHRRILPTLRDTGCLFVTSAFESFDDDVLRRLEKGHTAADARAAVLACRDAGLALSPTFVPFTPWTTIESYAGMLREIARLDLAPHVAAVQLGIRLLVPAASRLLELEEVRAVVGSFDPAALAHPWRSADPRVDELQSRVIALAGRRPDAPREEVFSQVNDLVREIAGPGAGPEGPPTYTGVARSPVPYLNEPWYC